MPTKNPPWQRDELILALDLYVRHGGRYLSDTHPEVVTLSHVLNALPIHAGSRAEGYRNPNGVSMKLLNFRRFDGRQAGKGLTRGTHAGFVDREQAFLGRVGGRLYRFPVPAGTREGDLRQN